MLVNTAIEFFECRSLTLNIPVKNGPLLLYSYIKPEPPNPIRFLSPVTKVLKYYSRYVFILYLIHNTYTETYNLLGTELQYVFIILTEQNTI